MIENNKVVTIDYTMTDENGVIIDSSDGKDPISFLHGAGNMVPGLEAELIGKTFDDEFDVTVAPENAYGERMDQLVSEVPAEAFTGVDKVEVGMAFNAETPQGPIPVTVTAISDEKITVDANHPLAGKTLTFRGIVHDVRDATEEELAHGHAH